MSKQYLVSNCRGQENVIKAIQDKTQDEDPPWDLHSITPAGLSTHSHPLDPSKSIAVMNFLVVFQREEPKFDA